jgi:hypothetical protein
MSSSQTSGDDEPVDSDVGIAAVTDVGTLAPPVNDTDAGKLVGIEDGTQATTIPASTSASKSRSIVRADVGIVTSTAAGADTGHDVGTVVGLEVGTSVGALLAQPTIATSEDSSAQEVAERLNVRRSRHRPARRHISRH